MSPFERPKGVPLVRMEIAAADRHLAIAVELACDADVDLSDDVPGIQPALGRVLLSAEALQSLLREGGLSDLHLARFLDTQGGETVTRRQPVARRREMQPRYTSAQDVWFQALIRDRTLDPRARGCAHIIGGLADPDGSAATLTWEQLAHQMQVSLATVGRALQTLRDGGWIEQTERGGRRGDSVRASTYRLNLPTSTPSGGRR